jgi:hypothetical protein
MVELLFLSVVLRVTNHNDGELFSLDGNDPGKQNDRRNHANEFEKHNSTFLVNVRDSVVCTK